MTRKCFVVYYVDLETFFDMRLGELGLNTKEIADFKEFWVVKLRAKNKPFYFITFLSKKFIDRLAPLNIDPKPDTIIRVMMDWKGLTEYKSVPAQELETSERKGFTVVEWGGMLK